ncbi:hypothetical protein CFH90_0080 (plasmid) [Acinetobacter johnsonii]|jgi:hypothetical protein|uniref:Uncharacterized protein n=1 Tax=Acinetobacter johnsonii TaxID=40214 RepID=A0A3S9AQ74_ACIJO|nr:hypothetical protein [Acinetobacter johnsonii]AZN65753.1 hypothetical protein CFH90_0025 [Acinetobacter johnsonii]AZN65754.1 hypothetical protein CFH90_0030 [Acinetobacter johnsonii]AZN65756.1 hypothetical protein CFH90_0040 [Acinetobacter johnsonii]AZN65841.1 hypothetical protein CFH90_0080 [Acinetobacter johnsonii]
MAYECKTLQIQGELPVCTEWQEASFLPELTSADRDLILQWAIGIFALVFVVKKIMRFF